MGCSLLGCVVLVWFWLVVAASFEWWVFGDFAVLGLASVYVLVLL